MSDRPTPETDAALYRGMTATMSHAMLQRLERERDEAIENWKRVSLEAEHWLSLSSQRQDEIDGLREQRNAAEKIAGQVDVLKCRIAELKGRLERSCVWTEDEDGNWDTGCGTCFVFNGGTPQDNKAEFCPYCGGNIVAKEWRHEQLED